MKLITTKNKTKYKKYLTSYKKLSDAINKPDLDKYGEEGVNQLSKNTPVKKSSESLTSESWYYVKKETKDKKSVTFCNSNIQNGVPIAVIIQHGHATKNGEWVEGEDYINPVTKKLKEEIIKDINKEVKKI